jgi:hypothetical protein
MSATDSSWAVEISIWSLNYSIVIPDDFFAETFCVGSVTTTGAAGVTGTSVTVDGVEIARSLT